VRCWLGDVFDREDGATAVEYALMAGLIALVIIAAVALLGQQTNSKFDDPRLISGLS
jgi:pilus assembly protein Flp/PilA